jgi:hypothetical protein
LGYVYEGYVSYIKIMPTACTTGTVLHRDLAVKYHIHDVVAWEEPWARRKNITQLEDQLANDIPQVCGCQGGSYCC